MILPDVNVLICAFRKDVPEHPAWRHWLTGVVEGDAPFGRSRTVLNGLVRITTNRKIFKTPRTLHDAFGLCDDRLGQPTARPSIPAAGTGHLLAI